VAVELASRPDFDPAFSHIIDFRGVTAANISAEFLRSFAEETPLFHREAKQIAVAPQPHIFGLARMTQILREGLLPNIEVVRTIEEAYKLLGLEQVS